MTAPLLATRDALTEALRKHTLLGDVCRCGWDGEEHSEIHAEHVADALVGVVRDPSTLAGDRRLVERVAADQKEAADSWGEPLPGSELNMRARTALRALAAALTEEPS